MASQGLLSMTLAVSGLLQVSAQPLPPPRQATLVVPATSAATTPGEAPTAALQPVADRVTNSSIHLTNLPARSPAPVIRKAPLANSQPSNGQRTARTPAHQLAPEVHIINRQSVPIGPTRIRPGLLPGSATGVSSTALAFDAEFKELTSEPEQTSAQFTFYLTNTATREVSINNVHTSCGCTCGPTTLATVENPARRQRPHRSDGGPAWQTRYPDQKRDGAKHQWREKPADQSVHSRCAHRLRHCLDWGSSRRGPGK